MFGNERMAQIPLLKKLLERVKKKILKEKPYKRVRVKWVCGLGWSLVVDARGAFLLEVQHVVQGLDRSFTTPLVGYDFKMELIGQINANLILMVNESVPEEDDKNNWIQFREYQTDSI